VHRGGGVDPCPLNTFVARGRDQSRRFCHGEVHRMARMQMLPRFEPESTPFEKLAELSAPLFP
jgi:hypothetical protein